MSDHNEDTYDKYRKNNILLPDLLMGSHPHGSPSLSEPLSLEGTPLLSGNEITSTQSMTQSTTIDMNHDPAQCLQRPSQYTGAIGELRSVYEIPQKYRHIFAEYPSFNVIQSKLLDDTLYSDKSLVVSAPTGSGKTVIFELAIIHLLIKLGNMKYTGNFKIVYMAPVKALCAERYQDWHNKFSRLGLNCQQVTGDTLDDDLCNLPNYNLILTTPEKWDSLTRKWKQNKQLVQVVKLFLIDEVHLLNEENRGPTLEAVVSRMKTVQDTLKTNSKTTKHLNQKNVSDIPIRFVAVSATIPNIEDLAAWLGEPNNPAVCVKIGEEYRPVKLKKIVIGFRPTFNQSPFVFEMNMSYRLRDILFTHAEGKPTLIFCSTRKSVIQTAQTLSKEITFHFNDEQKQKLLFAANNLIDQKLRDYVISGAGCHHAGMDMNDRRTMEDLFRASLLPVLTTTSTLAMGVNLPAHLVIIKSTQQYFCGVYQDYSDSQLLQMIGRAGRPQYDTTATAIIMTREQDKQRYERLVEGNDLIESNLHRHLAEYLNAEIVLETITDKYIAMNWIRSTFLYIRAMKKPQHYGISKDLTPKGIENKLQELCLRELNGLASANLVTIEDLMEIRPTETGKLMATYYLAFETMKIFTKITGNENLEDIVKLLASCHEFSDIQLRRAEKRVLNELNKTKDSECIRFPMKGVVRDTAMKVNVLVQAAFGCLLIKDHSLSQDSLRILRIGERVSKCLTKSLFKNESYNSLLNATIIAKCFYSKLWYDSIYVTKQLTGIGHAYSTLLASAGKTTFKSLIEANPRDLERILNKAPPLGNNLKNAAIHLPQYTLKLEMNETHDKAIISVTLVNLEVIMDYNTAGQYHWLSLLVGDNNNRILLKERFNDEMLLQYDGVLRRSMQIDASVTKVLGNLISDHWVGLDAQAMITVTRPVFKRTSDMMKMALQKYVTKLNIHPPPVQPPKTQLVTETAKKKKMSIIDQIKDKSRGLPDIKTRTLLYSKTPTRMIQTSLDEYLSTPVNNGKLPSSWSQFIAQNADVDKKKCLEIRSTEYEKVMPSSTPEPQVYKTEKIVHIISNCDEDFSENDASDEECLLPYAVRNSDFTKQYENPTASTYSQSQYEIPVSNLYSPCKSISLQQTTSSHHNNMDFWKDRTLENEVDECEWDTSIAQPDYEEPYKPTMHQRYNTDSTQNLYAQQYETTQTTSTQFNMIPAYDNFSPLEMLNDEEKIESCRSEEQLQKTATENHMMYNTKTTTNKKPNFQHYIPLKKDSDDENLNRAYTAPKIEQGPSESSLTARRLLHMDDSDIIAPSSNNYHLDTQQKLRDTFSACSSYFEELKEPFSSQKGCGNGQITMNATDYEDPIEIGNLPFAQETKTQIEVKHLAANSPSNDERMTNDPYKKNIHTKETLTGQDPHTIDEHVSQGPCEKDFEQSENDAATCYYFPDVMSQKIINSAPIIKANDDVQIECRDNRLKITEIMFKSEEKLTNSTSAEVADISTNSTDPFKTKLTTSQKVDSNYKVERLAPKSQISKFCPIFIKYNEDNVMNSSQERKPNNSTVTCNRLDNIEQISSDNQAQDMQSSLKSHTIVDDTYGSHPENKHIQELPLQTAPISFDLGLELLLAYVEDDNEEKYLATQPISKLPALNNVPQRNIYKRKWDSKDPIMALLYGPKLKTEEQRRSKGSTDESVNGNNIKTISTSPHQAPARAQQSATNREQTKIQSKQTAKTTVDQLIAPVSLRYGVPFHYKTPIKTMTPKMLHLIPDNRSPTQKLEKTMSITTNLPSQTYRNQLQKSSTFEFDQTTREESESNFLWRDSQMTFTQRSPIEEVHSSDERKGNTSQEKTIASSPTIMQANDDPTFKEEYSSFDDSPFGKSLLKASLASADPQDRLNSSCSNVMSKQCFPSNRIQTDFYNKMPEELNDYDSKMNTKRRKESFTSKQLRQQDYQDNIRQEWNQNYPHTQGMIKNFNSYIDRSQCVENTFHNISTQNQNLPHIGSYRNKNSRSSLSYHSHSTDNNYSQADFSHTPSIDKDELHTRHTCASLPNYHDTYEQSDSDGEHLPQTTFDYPTKNRQQVMSGTHRKRELEYLVPRNDLSPHQDQHTLTSHYSNNTRPIYNHQSVGREYQQDDYYHPTRYQQDITSSATQPERKKALQFPAESRKSHFIPTIYHEKFVEYEDSEQQNDSRHELTESTAGENWYKESMSHDSLQMKTRPICYSEQATPGLKIQSWNRFHQSMPRNQKTSLKQYCIEEPAHEKTYTEHKTAPICYENPPEWENDTVHSEHYKPVPPRSQTISPKRSDHLEYTQPMYTRYTTEESNINLRNKMFEDERSTEGKYSHHTYKGNDCKSLKPIEYKNNAPGDSDYMQKVTSISPQLYTTKISNEPNQNPHTNTGNPNNLSSTSFTTRNPVHISMRPNSSFLPPNHYNDAKTPLERGGLFQYCQKKTPNDLQHITSLKSSKRQFF